MIIKYATKEAKEKYEGIIEKKKIKSPCPDCEIKKQKKFNVEVIHNNGDDIIIETK